LPGLSLGFLYLFDLFLLSLFVVLSFYWFAVDYCILGMLMSGCFTSIVARVFTYLDSSFPLFWNLLV
jgi:hypothetical protein